MSLHIQLQLQQPQNCKTDLTRKATLIVHGHSLEQLQLACCLSQQTLLNAVECNQTPGNVFCHCACQSPFQHSLFSPSQLNTATSTTPRHSQRQKTPEPIHICTVAHSAAKLERTRHPTPKTKRCTHGTTRHTQNAYTNTPC